MDQVRIGNATVNFSRLTIEGDDGVYSVEPMVLEVLRVLLEKPGEVVLREELIDQVWGVSYGGDERLSRAISLLRKALGEDARSNRYIETIPKRGYRLIAAPAGASDKPDEAPPSRPKPAGRKLLVVAALLAIILGGTLSLPFLGGGFAAGVHDQDHRNTIAVLPFTDLSKLGDQKYLADGLTEEILDAITRFPELRVVGRTSSFSIQAAGGDPRKLASGLNTKYLLIGSLRAQDEQLRVSAQLVEADGGRIVWSQTFEGTTERIFEFQESIARSIAAELGVTIASQNRVLPKLTSNPQAYELFLQGRDLSRRFGVESKLASIKLLEQAIAADPDFALAWAWLGNTKLLMAVGAQPAQAKMLVSEARQAVAKAKAIDPGLAMGHFLQARLHEYDLDIAAAMDAVEQAYAADPNQPYLMIRRGRYYAMIGQTEKAAKLFEEGLRRDPTDAVGIINFAGVKLQMEDLDEAYRLALRSKDLGFAPANILVCALLARQGKAHEAQTCWNDLPDEMVERFRPPFNDPASFEAIGKAAYGRDTQARQFVRDRLQDHFSKPSPKVNAYLQELHLMIDAPGLFMERFVEHPYSGNSSGFTSIWLNDERSAQLRRHPAFPAFAERIGLVRAWNKYGWPRQCRRLPGSGANSAAFRCS